MKTLISILAAAIVLTACDNYRGIPVDESIYKIPNQDKALLTLERNVEDHYSLHLNDTFEGSQTYFTRGDYCPYAPERPAIVLDDGQCVAGIMWSCVEMYVALPDLPLEDQTVCGTALVHEFGHCLYMQMHGHGNHYHDDLEFWQIVTAASQTACARGW